MASSVRISRKAADWLLGMEQEFTWADGDAMFARRMFDELRAALKPRRIKPLRRASLQKKAQEKRTKKASWHMVRGAVFVRAGAVCECGCNRWFRGVGGEKQPDHFFGKARHESVETVWALRADCHDDKTNSRPDADFWRHKFITHCQRFGYLEAEALARADIESEADIAEAAELTGLDSIRMTRGAGNG